MTTMAVQHRTGDYYGDGTRNLIWEFRDEQGVAAELYVSVENREIANIETRADRRGEGLARRLYEAAAGQTTVLHAPVAHRTDEGNAFAQAVGGPIADYPCDCFGCTCDDEDED
jgi:GNAT superfamily N-acetyltransferase